MIKPIEKTEIPGRKMWSAVHSDIAEFMGGSSDCCEVIVPKGSTPQKYYASLMSAVRRVPEYRSSCTVHKRGARLFIARR